MTRLLTLSIFAAALFSLAFRPWGSGYFAIAGLAVLIMVLTTERTPWRAALAAAIMWLGLGIPALEGTAAGLWWGFPALLGLLSLGWLVMGATFAWLRRKMSPDTAVVTLAVILTATEFLMSRRWLLGESAVGLLAYTQADTAVRGLAHWSGTSAVTLGAVFIAAGASALLRKRWRLASGLLVPAIAFMLIPGPGTGHNPGGPHLMVGAVQSAQPSVEHVLALYDENVAAKLADTYTALARTAVAEGAELVVFGETVLPMTELDNPSSSVRNMMATAPATIAGSQERTRNGNFNSAFTWTGSRIEPIYRKQSLVPIIEDHFTAGDSTAPVMLQGALIGIGICLDTVHAGLTRSTVRQGAELLVFITDDSFAGVSNTPHVHLRTAAMRAAESGRAVVFANESGPSALFDHRGSELVSLELGEQGSIVAGVPLAVGTTTYVRFGDWLGWLSVAATALLAVGAHRMSHRQRHFP